MTRIEPLNSSKLVSALRDRPGRISAAVAPTGSFDELIEWLQEKLSSDPLQIEIARAGNPLDLARRANRLGTGLKDEPHDYIFLIIIDFSADSAAEEVDFWQGINLQREALAIGTMRTCFILDEDSSRNFAQLADDLWSWTSVYRLSDYQEVSLQVEGDQYTPPMEWRDRFTGTQLEDLRDRLDRAQSVGLAENIILKSYVIPLFLATPDAGEASQIWQGRLRHRVEIEDLAPEYLLAIGQQLLQLAKRKECRDFFRDLIEDSLAAVQKAYALLERSDRAVPQSSVSQSSVSRSSNRALVEVFQALAEAHQLNSNFREAIKWLDRAIERQDSGAEALGSLQIQKDAASILLQAFELSELPPLARPSRSPEDEKQEARSKSLGAALEISLTIAGSKEPDLIAHLFAAWVLSHRSFLEGPAFQEILEAAPEAYCHGVETIWLMSEDPPWEEHLRQPLVEAWRFEDEVICPVLRNEFAKWLSPPQAQIPSIAGAYSDLEYRRWDLQRLAIGVLGHRYEPEAVRILCDHIDLFDDSDEGRRDRYLAVRRVGFMLRWSYQEPVLEELRQLADRKGVSNSTMVLAEELKQVDPSIEASQEPSLEPHEPTFSERLKHGEADLLTQTGSLPTDPSEGISRMAGDPDVPDLSAEDLAFLRERLIALVDRGIGRGDQGQMTEDDSRFDTWLPWLARCHPREWWTTVSYLVEKRLDVRHPPSVLRQFPALGVLEEGATLSEKIVIGMDRATADNDEGENQRRNFGLSPFLRWVAHLESSDALLQCLTYLKQEEYAKFLTFAPTPWALRYTMPTEIFEEAGRRRQAVEGDAERKLWFLVEWIYVERLLIDERWSDALQWCVTTLPDVVHTRELADLLYDRLRAVRGDEALLLLLDRHSSFTDDYEQARILYRIEAFGEIDTLKAHPEFIDSLTIFSQGIYAFRFGDDNDLRQWGFRFLKVIASPERDFSAISRNLLEDLIVRPWYRDVLHRWAELETAAFLEAAEQIHSEAAEADYSFYSGHRAPALLDAVFIVWLSLDPHAAYDVWRNKERPKRFSWSFSFTDKNIRLHIHALWDPEYCSLPEHREIRLQVLRDCISDQKIAEHTLAARIHGMQDEVAAIGEILLASELQLERALGVSLLAWHPEGERLLQNLPESDPSQWVRHHAGWAIEISRRDRIGRELYVQALQAEDWLHQQALFEQLYPLILPTFPVWRHEDPKIQELIDQLSPRRKALLADFGYYCRQRPVKNWTLSVDRNGWLDGRDLEKFCRGEDISGHLQLGEKGPPWQGDHRSKAGR